MKKSNLKYYLLVALLPALACSKKINKSIETSMVLKVQFTSSYCQGMRPSEELLDSISQLRPFRNGKLILISNDGKRKEVQLDSQGESKVNLIKGSYQVFHSDKLKEYPNDVIGVNYSKCSTWKKTPDFIFELSKDNQIIENKLHQSCSPCELARP